MFFLLTAGCGSSVKVYSLSVKIHSISYVSKNFPQPIVTGCLSPLVSLSQDRHAATCWARQASLSLRSRPKLSSTEPRNKSFSSASQPDGQNQHMASREQRAWAGDWSRTKSSVKVVRWRHDWGASAVTTGDTIGMATAMAASGTPLALILARSGSCRIWTPDGPSVVVFISSSTSPTCLQWEGLTRAG